MGICCFKNESIKSDSEGDYMHFENISNKSIHEKNLKTHYIRANSYGEKPIIKFKKHSLDDSTIHNKSIEKTFRRMKSNLVLLELFEMMEKLPNVCLTAFFGEFLHFPKSQFYRLKELSDYMFHTEIGTSRIDCFIDFFYNTMQISNIDILVFEIYEFTPSRLKNAKKMLKYLMEQNVRCFIVICFTHEENSSFFVDISEDLSIELETKIIDSYTIMKFLLKNEEKSENKVLSLSSKLQIYDYVSFKKQNFCKTFHKEHGHEIGTHNKLDNYGEERFTCDCCTGALKASI